MQVHDSDATLVRHIERFGSHNIIMVNIAGIHWRCNQIYTYKYLALTCPKP